MTDQSSQLFPAELRQMTQLIFVFMISQAIAVAAKLGIADLRRNSPGPPRSWQTPRKLTRLR